MLLRSGLAALAVCAFAGFSIRAWGDVPESQYVYLRALSGVYAPLDGRQGPQLGYGASVGIRASPYFALGAYLTHSSQTLRVVTSETAVQNFAFGPEIVYFAKDLDGFEGLQVGLKSGLTYRTFNSRSTLFGLDIEEKSGGLNVVLGPSLGYEYTMDFGLAFGAEGFVLYDFADGRAGPLSVLMSVRGWF